MRHAPIALFILMVPVLADCRSKSSANHQAGVVPISASVWALRSLENRSVPRFHLEAVTLRLQPDHGIGGTASCNSVGGNEFTWTAVSSARGSFAREPSQPTITTAVGCNDVAATQIADRFWTLMSKAREWSIDRDNLSIRFDDGTVAVLKAIGQPATASIDCRSADSNNLDCLNAANPWEGERDE